MKKFLACGAAAVALLGFAPAVAQTAQTVPQAQAGEHSAKLHTRAEVQSRIAEHFARLDSNRDGFVTRAEADAVRAQLRARAGERRAERRGQAFERLDANNDGSVSRAEFEAPRAQRTAERGQRDRRAGVGKRGGGHRMAMIGGRMFDMADANNDARVSLPEAQAIALQHFDRADANRDGQITPDERRQMRQRMINERRPG